MKNWLPSIFAVDKHSTIGADAFNHCASLCPYESGVLLAWYSGSGECQDDQSVYVSYLSHDNYSTPFRIGDKTGNPIIWRENGQNWLLWSRFEDDGPITSLAHRWKHCSLWIQRITYKQNIELLGEPQKIANSSSHLLARTSPLIMPKTVLLPLYDEVQRECVIYQGSNGEFNETSRYGGTSGIIQPTIWSENRRLHSLSRNFGNNKFRSIYYYSDDFGHAWKYGGLSHCWNINNSLVVGKWGKHNIVLWNDINSFHRENMAIGVLEWTAAVPHPHRLTILNKQHGSYPCFCVTDNGQLHFAYTGPTRQIEYHIWNRKTLQKYLSRS